MLLASVRELRSQLLSTALMQIRELLSSSDSWHEEDVLSNVRSAALSGDSDKMDEAKHRFLEHLDYIQEMCKMLCHITTSDALQIASRYTEINLRIYGPQVLTAANTLCLYPPSKCAKTTFD
ncbi:unnamed protein product, partial [Cyprideis torosa]